MGLLIWSTSRVYQCVNYIQGVLIIYSHWWEREIAGVLMSSSLPQICRMDLNSHHEGSLSDFRKRLLRWFYLFAMIIQLNSAENLCIHYEALLVMWRCGLNLAQERLNLVVLWRHILPLGILLMAKQTKMLWAYTAGKLTSDWEGILGDVLRERVTDI